MLRRLRRLLHEPAQGATLRKDLEAGLPTLPAWMQATLRTAMANPSP